MKEGKPFEIPLTLDVPFALHYNLKDGTITIEGAALVVQPGAAASGAQPPSQHQSFLPEPGLGPRVRLSLTPQATTSLLIEIDRLVRHSRDILNAAGDGSPHKMTWSETRPLERSILGRVGLSPP